MVEVIRGTGTLLSLIGVGVLRNATDIPFLTSDNPVVWFDPSVPESEMRPYHVRRDGPILFLFPVAPDLCIYGDNVMRKQFAHSGLAYADAREPESITAINRQICRFAYKAVFAQTGGQRDLVREYAELSPVVETETAIVNGKQTQIFRNVFGSRTRKPKWQS
jgi:hypothetical protein